MYINPQYLHKEKAKKNIYMALTIIFKNGFLYFRTKKSKNMFNNQKLFFFLLLENRVLKNNYTNIYDD